jgi:glycosyltransferase involved in cell wall biosynthesis
LIPEQRVLDRHRWIPSLAHDDLLAEMSRHDVLVFPSLHEGFGLVILEAMSQGLAVITTPHTGGPDVIREGQDGFIVPIRSADAIAEKLGLLAGDRLMLAEMKEAARETARRHTWENYRKRLVEVVRGAVGVRE